MTRPQSKAASAASAGALLGYGLWLVSPIVAGCAEPWDASFPLYTPVLVVGGALGGGLLPGRAIAFLLGLWIGQVLALATLPDHQRSWILLGAVTTAIGATVSVPSYVAASFLRKRCAARRLPGG